MYRLKALFGKLLRFNPKRMWSRLRIKTKMITGAILLLALAVLISYSVSYWIFKNSLIKNIEEYSIDINNNKIKLIENYFSDMDMLAYTIGYSNWIQQAIIQREFINIYERYQVEKNTKHFLNCMSQINDGIGIMIVSKENVKYTNSGFGELNQSYSMENEYWYNEFSEHGRVIEPDSAQNYLLSKDRYPSVSLIYSFKNYLSLEIIGTLVFDINKSKFDELLASDMHQYNTVVLDKHNRFVYKDIDVENLIEVFTSNINTEKNETKVIYHSIGGSMYIIAGGSVDNTGWKIYSIFPYSQVEKEMMDSWKVIIVAMIPVLILLVMTVAYYSYKVTVPILTIKEAMSQIRNNNLGVQLDNPYEDEIGELVDGFNEMSASIVTLIKENKSMALLHKEAELAMLQQKVNPHFLYNTLEIINGLIMQDKKREAANICEILGEMFRYNLREDRYVKLEEELEYIKKYLAIVKYRTPNVYISLDYDKDILGMRVLKFILQPLVENSIKHGFGNRRGEFCLTITVTREERDIVFVVMDNGAGIDKKDLDSIITMLKSISQEEMTEEEKMHIGIRNIYKRLVLEYGNRFSFNIYSEKHRGTRIEIRIPEENGGFIQDV
ncbi:MAG: histidine kinase [Clostridiaceae bacterium]|jgi:two-component system sensor histidine kinase YesM|nr:histidine kinase [Clostridiaceae bacterium]